MHDFSAQQQLQQCDAVLAPGGGNPVSTAMDLPSSMSIAGCAMPGFPRLIVVVVDVVLLFILAVYSHIGSVVKTSKGDRDPLV